MLIRRWKVAGSGSMNGKVHAQRRLGTGANSVARTVPPLVICDPELWVPLGASGQYHQNQSLFLLNAHPLCTELTQTSTRSKLSQELIKPPQTSTNLANDHN
jgi:hypothetical protein